jgi:hypothetical protein
MKTYDRRAARAYAIKYVFNYNTGWPSDRRLGGDCTNFVSQCLLAGGWTMVRRGTIVGSARDGGSWFSGKAGCDLDSDRSRTWAAAANFNRYLFWGGRARACKVEDLAVGDVVLKSEFGIIHHTMIVTELLRTGVSDRLLPLLTYHTNDVLNRPITDLNLNNLLCWKISDTFEEKVPYSIPRAG